MPLDAYMREHSDTIRVFNPRLVDEEADDELSCDPATSVLLRPLLRHRQRLLATVWSQWVLATGLVDHDYTADLLSILRRRMPPDEPRSELEVECIAKWVARYKSDDPTSIASVIRRCTSKRMRVQLMQDMRVEAFSRGDVIVHQTDAAGGHMTVLAGQCEAFPLFSDAKQLHDLTASMRSKSYSDARAVLSDLPSAYTLGPGTGYGELCCACALPWICTIAAHREVDVSVVVLFVSKAPFRRALESIAGTVGAALDYIRSYGLVRCVGLEQQLYLATRMSKVQCSACEVLYTHSAPADRLLFLVAGEVLLDTSLPCARGAEFLKAPPAACFVLGAGCMLGDEGLLGHPKVYASTCAATQHSLLFAVADPLALAAVAALLKNARIAAMTYKNKLRFSAANRHLDELNVYAFFGSLRRSISFRNEFRGVCADLWRETPVTPAEPQTRTHDSSPSASTRDSQVCGVRLLSRASQRKLDLIMRALRKAERQCKLKSAQSSLLSEELSFNNEESYLLQPFQRSLECNRARSAALSSRIASGPRVSSDNTHNASPSKIDEYYDAMRETRVGTAPSRTQVYGSARLPSPAVLTADAREFRSLFANSRGKSIVPEMSFRNLSSSAPSPHRDTPTPVTSVPKPKLHRSAHSLSRRATHAHIKKELSVIFPTVSMEKIDYDLFGHIGDCTRSKVTNPAAGVVADHSARRRTKTPPDKLVLEPAIPSRRSSAVVSTDERGDAQSPNVPSTAMKKFQELITSDLISLRGSNILGRKFGISNSKFRIGGKPLSTRESSDGILAWKSYCIESASKFNLQGRETMPVLEQRKNNPSSFRWANSLHMTTHPSSYDAEARAKPSSYLKAYKERYHLTKRPPLHEPKICTR